MDAEHALYKDIMIDKADTELLELYAQQLMVRPFCCDLRGFFVRIDPLAVWIGSHCGPRLRLLRLNEVCAGRRLSGG